MAPELGWVPMEKTKTVAAQPDWHLHDLMHFYASGLIYAGCDVVTVQRALGHSSPNLTLSTYAHLWPNADDRSRKAADSLFRACAPSRTDVPDARHLDEIPAF